MNTSSGAVNAHQIEYWNGDAGENWARQADGLDFMLREVGETLLEHAALREGERVLDIGCGSGAVTIAAQDLLGNIGQATGLDISRPLILEAQRRAAARKSRATFIQADAATWRSETEVDTIVSRLGVMFFEDPVAAFANLLQPAKRGGRLNFVCWCSPKQSDMGSGLMSAVSSLFEKPATPPDPTAPGPFAFSDRARVGAILTDAGWQDVRFEKWEGNLPVPGSNIRESAEFAARMGTIARLAREQNVAIDRVVDALVPFLEQRIERGRVALRGVAWLVSARRL